MIRREDLILVNANAALVAAAIGTAVPANMRRYYYKIHTLNLFAGINIVTVSWGPVAGITANFETIGHTLVNDQYVDPEDGIKEDSLPLYIIDGGTTAVNFLWLTASAGNCTVSLWYEDGV